MLHFTRSSLHSLWLWRLFGLYFLIVQGNPALGPTGDLVERVLELPAFAGQLVFDSDRALGNYGPRDETLGLEGPKPLGQHAVSDIRNCELKRRVTRSALKECLHDGASPATTDELDGAVETGANGRNLGRIVH